MAVTTIATTVPRDAIREDTRQVPRSQRICVKVALGPICIRFEARVRFFEIIEQATERMPWSERPRS